MKMMLLAVAGLCLGCQNDSRTAAVAALELPSGSRTLTGPATPAAGPATRVETEACVPAGTGAAAAEAVRASLSPAWGELRVLPSGDRWVVVGEKDGLGVSGTVDEKRAGACRAGEVYVNVGVHEIPAAGGKDRFVGARGPRAAAAGRLPIVPPQGK